MACALLEDAPLPITETGYRSHFTRSRGHLWRPRRLCRGIARNRKPGSRLACRGTGASSALALLEGDDSTLASARVRLDDANSSGEDDGDQTDRMTFMIFEINAALDTSRYDHISIADVHGAIK